MLRYMGLYEIMSGVYIYIWLCYGYITVMYLEGQGDLVRNGEEIRSYHVM